VVGTRPEVVSEEFVGGRDQARSGERGVCGWSGPGPNWGTRSLWVVGTRPKLVHEGFGGILTPTSWGPRPVRRTASGIRMRYWPCQRSDCWLGWHHFPTEPGVFGAYSIVPQIPGIPSALGSAHGKHQLRSLPVYPYP